MSKLGLILLVSMASTIVAYPARIFGGPESIPSRIPRSADPDPGHHHHGSDLDGFVGISFGGGGYDPGYSGGGYHHHKHHGYGNHGGGYGNNGYGGYNHGYGGQNHGYNNGYDGHNHGYGGHNHGYHNERENYPQQIGTNSQAQSSAQSGSINTPFGSASFANANANAGAQGFGR